MNHRAPLFVKLAVHALAIVTNDTSILLANARAQGSDPLVKYHPDVTQLSALQEVIKGNPDGALSALSRALHAAPWATGHRRRLSTLLVQAASPQGELEALRRFLRVTLPKESGAVETGDARAGRVRLLAIGRLARRPRAAIPPAAEGEEGLEAQAGGEAEAEVLLQKSVFLAPWLTGGREDLAKVRRMMGGRTAGLVA